MIGPCIHVLMIEDNRGDARLVQETLKGASDPSFRVEWVDRLSSGLARLAAGGLDVILLDLGLPDSQGLEALPQLRALAPTIPVVVLSGTENEALAMEAVRTGAQDYLVKSDPCAHQLARSLGYAIQRKLADEALRASEERLSMAMNAAHESIWESNPVTRLVRWNKEHDRALVAPETPPSSEPWEARIHAEDRERVCKSFHDALQGSARFWSAEYRFLGSDGEWSFIQDRAIIARDSAGKATRAVGAMLDVTDLKRTEETLHESNRRLRQLSRDLLRAQDYERRRIARELHDSTSQLLTALSIDLSRLEEPGMGPEKRRQVLSEAKELAADCFKEIRTVTCLLHPPLLDDVGLATALRSYAEGFNKRTGIRVEVNISSDFGRLGNEQEGALFRIVQEGLANVHQHSGSSLAVIRLERDQQEARLVLQDRGHGVPTQLHDHPEGFVRFGIGILGMRERAEQLGGRLELDSSEIGTRLTVSLPLGVAQ